MSKAGSPTWCRRTSSSITPSATTSCAGKHTAWIAGDFPARPWDQTRLYVAELGDVALGEVRQVAGGDGVSVQEPQWGADGTLTWISDESGFWNLYDDRDSAPRPTLPPRAE